MVSWSIDLLLALLRHGQVEDGLARLHAELLGPGHGAQDLGGLQQLLGRDAAPVQARAADPGLFDHPDRQPGRRAVEGGGIPAGPATEDDDIEFLRHETSSSNTLQLSKHRAGETPTPPRPHERQFVALGIPLGSRATPLPHLADLTPGSHHGYR